jgi:hypothetical protein
VSPIRFSSRIESVGPDPVYGFSLPLESSCFRSDLRVGPHPQIGSQFAGVAFCVVLLPSGTPALTVAAQFRSSSFGKVVILLWFLLCGLLQADVLGYSS